jgi:hypothetical protein
MFDRQGMGQAVFEGILQFRPKEASHVLLAGGGVMNNHAASSHLLILNSELNWGLVSGALQCYFVELVCRS